MGFLGCDLDDNSLKRSGWDYHAIPAILGYDLDDNSLKRSGWDYPAIPAILAIPVIPVTPVNLCRLMLAYVGLSLTAKAGHPHPRKVKVAKTDVDISLRPSSLVGLSWLALSAHNVHFSPY